MLILAFCILFTLTISFFYVFKYRNYGVFSASVLAVAVKLILGTLGVFISLPFSGADAVKFEGMAANWSELPITDILNNIDVSGSYVISSVTAILYSLLEVNIAIPIFVNVCLSILVFFLTLKLANRVWQDQRLNGFFAFVLAIQPVMNVNSAIVLRETYIYFFVVLAAISIVNFAWTGRVRYGLFYFIYVVLASFFHGAMFLLALGLPIYVLVAPGLSLWKKLSLGTFLILVAVVAWLSFDFNKLTAVQDSLIFGVEFYQDLEANRQDANTAYLTNLAPNNLFDLIWQAPIRVLYLLLKPFPWDIQSFGHFIVFIDAMLWLLILFLLIKNWSTIRRNPACLALICTVAIVLVAFSYGTSNFGTGVRHRTKFFVIAWVLVYPFLPRFRLHGPP